MRCLDRPFFGCSRFCRSKMLQVSRDDARAIESVIRTILAEQRDGRLAGVDEMIVKKVAQILVSFGMGEDRQDMRVDFQHLRRWRKIAGAKLRNQSGYYPGRHRLRISITWRQGVTWKIAILTNAVRTNGSIRDIWGGLSRYVDSTLAVRYFSS